MSGLTLSSRLLGICYLASFCCGGGYILLTSFLIVGSVYLVLVSPLILSSLLKLSTASSAVRLSSLFVMTRTWLPVLPA